MTTGDQPQPLTLGEAIIPVASLILLIALSYHLFGDAGADGPIQVALVAATMVAVVIAWRRGHSLDALREGAIASVSSGMSAIFILFGVGALIGTWAMSGTLLAMIYYGLHLLSPNFFYMTAALICAVVSAAIGTSWTVVGTIGVGLMGISQNMEMNPAITAAAIISGAYFGDTTSPVSGSPNLAAAAAGAEFYDNVRETFVISAAALAIRRLRCQRQDGSYRRDIPHVARSVPAPDRRGRPGDAQGTALHRDLRRRARRRRARRAGGAGARDRVRRRT
jgi:NhaC family Na+:H+ antiporter